MHKPTTACIALSLAFMFAGCGRFAERLAVALFYQEADSPRTQIYKDIIYWTDRDADERRHRLDFYVPNGGRWPVLIFVHGGGWKYGDKALKFGNADPYGNIGRFYATRGIGVAVINYRLQPKVSWREQIRDVAQALAWAYRHAYDYGADERALFLFGHSSGAQLAARAALDREALAESGLPPGIPCGVIAVSGAPYDIADEKTYELGTERALFEQPFRTNDSDDRWKYEASAVNFVTPSAPRFLLLHGRWETKGLKRQNQVLHQALRKASVPSRLVETSWDGHFLINASLSHPDRMASAAVLEFIHTTKCD